MAAAWFLLRSTLFFSFFLFLSRMAYSITESEALLQLKKSLTKADALSSWVSGSSPCNGEVHWNGVICYNGIVTGLRLEGMGLSGEIDVDALLEIPGIRSISIMDNAFSGAIPELNRLGALKAIYLSGNQFSGEIPSDYFAKMESLKKVFMSDNKFMGKIPSSLVQLPNLLELYLQNNQFSGSVPSIVQPTLMALNVSNNQLEGEIPASLSKFSPSSFAGNAGLCGEKLGKRCPKAAEQTTASDIKNAQPSTGNEDSSKTLIVVVLTATTVLLSIIAVGVVRFRRKREDLGAPGDEKRIAEEEAVAVHVSQSGPTKKETDSTRKGVGSSGRKASNNGKGGGMGELVVLNNEKGVFGLPDLMKSSAEVLGNGALGSSYKVVMANRMAVVVKRMKEMNALGRDGFGAEMKRLANLRHGNILTPLAYHHRKDEKLLVYEFIPRGSLLYLLHADRGPSNADFDWAARLKIVKGTAEGMGYLHTELASSNIPHGNLKSSNILIGPGYEPLLSDYGFSPLINPASVAQELFASKAPEVALSGKLSPKCDVYCLGIVILEILTGKYPSQYIGSNKGGTDVVQWVASAIADGRESELLDPEIASSAKNLSEMEKLLHIGAACTESYPEQRLDMMEAIKRIVEVQEEGSQEAAKRILVLPSLRDGYADSLPLAHVSKSSQESLGSHSGRILGSDSLESRSGRLGDDSFAFAIS